LLNICLNNTQSSNHSFWLTWLILWYSNLFTTTALMVAETKKTHIIAVLLTDDKNGAVIANNLETKLTIAKAVDTTSGCIIMFVTSMR